MHGLAAAAAALLSTLGPAPGARAEDTRPREMARMLSAEERAALHGRLSRRTVALSRLLPPPKGMTAPVPDLRVGAGLCLDPDHFLTSAAFVADWPMAGRAGADALTWRTSGPGQPSGGWPLEVRWRDLDLGLAVVGLAPALLDAGGTERLAAARAPLLCGLPGPEATPWDLDQGALLRAAVDGVPGLREVGTRGHGAGVFGFYIRGAGDPLPPGTPVFATSGALLSIVGAQEPDAPGISLILPTQAISAFAKEHPEWAIRTQP